MAEFDLEDPNLPSWVKAAALTAGGFPYERKLDKETYAEALYGLQVELVKALAWVRKEGMRVAVLIEGRDAAGKGGVIKTVREHLNPRYARIVALAAPSEQERGQWYFQRYVAELPGSGEMVLFDRSWYNRGVVEPVMGFCTPEQAQTFLKEAPDFERMLVRDGIFLFKYWLNIGRETQLKRFHDRRHNPLKVWKISPVDLRAIAQWEAFTAARQQMLRATHTLEAPWTIVRANDKRRARINLIRHFLRALPYEGKDIGVIGVADPQIVGSGAGFLSADE